MSTELLNAMRSARSVSLTEKENPGSVAGSRKEEGYAPLPPSLPLTRTCLSFLTLLSNRVRIVHSNWPTAGRCQCCPSASTSVSLHIAFPIARIQLSVCIRLRWVCTTFAPRVSIVKLAMSYLYISTDHTESYYGWNGVSNFSLVQ